MSPVTSRRIRPLALAALLLSPLSALAGNGIVSASPVAYPGETLSSGGSFTPTHVHAWKESRLGKSVTKVFFTERDIPAAGWIDATDRQRALIALLKTAQAPYAYWTILDADKRIEGSMSCSPDSVCASGGADEINGIPMSRAMLETDGNRLRGRIEQASGVCGDGEGKYDWCDVASSFQIDVDLLPAPLMDRIAMQGDASGADAAAAKKALAEYWKAAGKAKKPSDLHTFHSSAQQAENAALAERMGEHMDEMFREMFVPMHAGTLDILDTKVLNDTALAHIQTRTTGEWAEDIQCRILMRKEAGAWKVEQEDC